MDIASYTDSYPHVDTDTDPLPVLLTLDRALNGVRGGNIPAASGTLLTSAGDATWMTASRRGL